MPRPLLSSLLTHPQLGSQVFHLLPLNEAFEFRGVSSECQNLMENVLVEAAIQESASATADVLTGDACCQSPHSRHRNHSSRVHFWYAFNTEVVTQSSSPSEFNSRKGKGEWKSLRPTEASRSLQGMVQRFLGIFEERTAGGGDPLADGGECGHLITLENASARTSLGMRFEAYLRENVFTNQLRQIGSRKWLNTSQFLSSWITWTGSEYEEALTLALPESMNHFPVPSLFTLEVMADCAERGEMDHLEFWNLNSAGLNNILNIAGYVPITNVTGAKSSSNQQQQFSPTTKSSMIETITALLVRILKCQKNLKEIVFPSWSLYFTADQTRTLLEALPPSVELLVAPAWETGTGQDEWGKNHEEALRSLFVWQSVLDEGKLRCAPGLKRLDLTRWLRTPRYDQNFWSLVGSYPSSVELKTTSEKAGTTVTSRAEQSATTTMKLLDEFFSLLDRRCPSLEALALPGSEILRKERNDTQEISLRHAREMFMAERLLSGFKKLRWLELSLTSPNAIEMSVRSGTDVSGKRKLLTVSSFSTQAEKEEEEAVDRCDSFTALSIIGDVPQRDTLKTLELAVTGLSTSTCVVGWENTTFQYSFSELKFLFVKVGPSLQSAFLEVRNVSEIEEFFSLCPNLEGIGFLLAAESDNQTACFPNERLGAAFRLAPKLREIQLYDKHELGHMRNDENGNADLDFVPEKALSSLDDVFLWSLSKSTPNLTEFALANKFRKSNFSQQMFGLCCRHGWRQSLRKAELTVKTEKITNQQLLWTLGDDLLSEDYLPVPEVCPKLLFFKTLPGASQEESVEKWHYYYVETLLHRGLSHFESYEVLQKYFPNGEYGERIKELSLTSWSSSKKR